MTTSPTPAADWIDFQVGSPCPVLLEERVEVRLRNGQSRQDQAGALRWSARDDTDGYDIIAYRVVSPTPASAKGEEPDIDHAFQALENFRSYGYGIWSVGAAIDTLKAALQPQPSQQAGTEGDKLTCQVCGGEIQGWTCQGCGRTLRDNPEGHPVFDAGPNEGGNLFAPLRREPLAAITSLDGSVRQPLICITVEERDAILALFHAGETKGDGRG